MTKEYYINIFKDYGYLPLLYAKDYFELIEEYEECSIIRDVMLQIKEEKPDENVQLKLTDKLVQEVQEALYIKGYKNVDVEKVCLRKLEDIKKTFNNH